MVAVCSHRRKSDQITYRLWKSNHCICNG